MTPEVLAKLTASSVDTTQIRVDGQSIPTHTAGEIAGALAHCSEGAQLYASVFFMGADEYRDWLMGEIRLELAGIWDKRGWKIRAPGVLSGLAWLAIFEETPENTRCPKCKGAKGLELQDRVCGACYGTGGRHNQKCTECDGSGKQVISCALCNGSGIQRIGQEMKAEIVNQCLKAGYSLEWDKKIDYQYEVAVRPILSGWNSEIWSVLGLHLGVDGEFL